MVHEGRYFMVEHFPAYCEGCQHIEQLCPSPRLPCHAHRLRATFFTTVGKFRIENSKNFFEISALDTLFWDDAP
jgi:hypothetical protein